MTTRKDIADRLGVSVSVVSRALNNSGYVQPDKKDAILNLARELGYTREPAALRDGGQSSRRLLLYTENTRNPFYIEFFIGMDDAAQKLGYTVMRCRLPGPGEGSVADAAGLVFSSEAVADAYLNGVGRNDFTPAVCAAFGDVRQLPRHVTIIECDLWRGTEVLIDYLRQRGHRRIAAISPFPLSNTDARLQCWRSCMLPEFGARMDEYFLSITDDTRAANGSLLAGGSGIAHLSAEDYFENGVLGARHFVESACDATAAICFNEEMALGFIKALSALGRRVPEDISVIGYDGTYLRRYFDKPLTVLDMQPYRQGQRCVEALADLIRGRKVRNQRVVPTTILEGATVRDLNRK